MNGNSFLKYIHSTFFLVFSLCLLFACKASLALPFTIVPKAGVPMPGTVAKGTSVFAYYTVYNNTISARNNNYVKYLPPNVKQVTTNGTYPDTCASSFNLSAKGKAGDSCTLQLTVSGPVDAADRNPHHHLFVCFPGGVSCAGTQEPLNITGSQSLLNVAYVTNSFGNSVSQCPIQKEGILGVCSVALGLPATQGIDFNPSHTIAYMTTILLGEIVYCMKNSDGTLGSCDTTPLSSSPGFFSGIVINSLGTYIYITFMDFVNSSAITYYCSVDNDGKPDNCTTTGPSFSYPPTAPPLAITLNSTQTYAYITSPAENSVTSCGINNFDGSFTICTVNQDPLFMFEVPIATAITPTNSFAYVIMANGDVALCPIKPDGSFDPCISAGNNNVFSYPTSITLNSTGTLAYITNTNSDQISSCPIRANGQFGTCTTSGNGLQRPSDMALI